MTRDKLLRAFVEDISRECRDEHRATQPGTPNLPAAIEEPGDCLILPLPRQQYEPDSSDESEGSDVVEVTTKVTRSALSDALIASCSDDHGLPGEASDLLLEGIEPICPS